MQENGIFPQLRAHPFSRTTTLFPLLEDGPFESTLWILISPIRYPRFVNVLDAHALILATNFFTTIVARAYYLYPDPLFSLSLLRFEAMRGDPQS